jgi:hypothetical protein
LELAFFLGSIDVDRYLQVGTTVGKGVSKGLIQEKK